MAVAAAAQSLPLESKLAPFNPASDTAIQTAVRFLSLRPLETAVDVGCGDGRVLVALAASCPDACVRGVEYNAELVSRAENRIAEAGLGNAVVVCGDATRPEHQTSGVAAVFVYLTPSGLTMLEPFLQRVLIDGGGASGGRIVSNAFRIPGWAERGWLRETVRDPHGLAVYCYALPTESADGKSLVSDGS